MEQWIRFDDEFPDINFHVQVLTFEILLHIETGETIDCMCVEDVACLYEDENGAYSDPGGGENLTHWMPLPKRPKDT